MEQMETRNRKELSGSERGGRNEELVTSAQKKKMTKTGAGMQLRVCP